MKQKQLMRICVVIALSAVFVPVSAFGQVLTKAQMKVLREQLTMTNTEDACAIGNASIPNGTPEQNGKAIFDYLTAPGRLKPFQAAGVIGNMVAESGLSPQRLEGTGLKTITTAEAYKSSGSSAGWGLVQFTPGSKFIDTVTPIAKANELGTQVAFVWDQLEGRTTIPEKRAGDELKATTTLEEAVLAFQGNSSAGGKYYGYERPKDQTGTVDDRTANARVALATYGSGVGATSTSSTVVSCGETAAGSSNVSKDGYTLPLDQKFYDTHPEWFTKPHHDHPASDIPVATGTKVYAMHGGKITKAPTNGGYSACGTGVIIEGEDGHEYWYCHGTDGGSITGAKEGDTVTAGQLIMHSGNTGDSTGPHLHVAIKVGGAKVCPQSLFDALGKNAPTIPAVNTLPRSGCTY